MASIPNSNTVQTYAAMIDLAVTLGESAASLIHNIRTHASENLTDEEWAQLESGFARLAAETAELPPAAPGKPAAPLG